MYICVISAVAVVFVCDLQAMKENPMSGGSSSSSATMTKELSPADEGIMAINELSTSLIALGDTNKKQLEFIVGLWANRARDFSQSKKTLLPIEALIGLCGDTEEEVRAFFSKLPGVKFAEAGSEDAAEKMKKIDERKRDAAEKMKKIDKIRQEARYEEARPEAERLGKQQVKIEEAMGRKKYMGYEFRIGYDGDKAESKRSEINEQLDKTYHFGFDKSNLE